MMTSSLRGFTLVLVLALLAAAACAFVSVELGSFGTGARRDAISERALAQAREALVAYAADRPINAAVGPGYLPCPDLDDDGWAESTCGSQSGESGQSSRLGRLPWKTLGLPDLRDGHGERLWYAVSSKHKGLLNCAASRACLDMSPDSAIGTISVRDASGALIHDGTSPDLYNADRGGALAVVIAPGARLNEQKRECGPGECDGAGVCLLDPPQRVAKCNPANYLDRAPTGAYVSEDNADFVDRNDSAGRWRNTNGFIQGPVPGPDGFLAVNDRLAVISYRDVMPRVMKRVALEVAQCLAFYATRPENAGRYPTPTPLAQQDSADVAAAWADGLRVAFGRVPDTPFTRTRDASGGKMLERWWRHEPRSPDVLADLPTGDRSCRIAHEPADEGPVRRSAAGTPAEEGRTAGLGEVAWWTYWKPFVFYALAPGYRADGDGGCDSQPCLEVIDAGGAVLAANKHFAVLVAGAPLALPSFAQRHGYGLSEVRDWLESPQCSASSCARVVRADSGPVFNDVVVAYP
jgi:hypothetical protein